MMSDSVVKFPSGDSVMTRDTSPQSVLQSAMESALEDVVVVGRTINGGIAVWGSQVDADAVIGLLNRGITRIVDLK